MNWCCKWKSFSDNVDVFTWRRLCIDITSLTLKCGVLRTLHPYPIEWPISKSLIRDMFLYWSYLMFNNWYSFMQNVIPLVYLMAILLNVSTYFPNTPRMSWLDLFAWVCSSCKEHTASKIYKMKKSYPHWVASHFSQLGEAHTNEIKHDFYPE